MTEQAKHETALDSDEQQIGGLYAKALLSSAGDSVDHIVYELESVVRECLDAHPALETALDSPRISQEHKEGMLDRIFRDRIDGRLLNFLKILCRRDRISNLRAIQQTTTLLREEQCGKMRVIVTSAHPLSDDQRNHIAHQLQQSYGKEPVLVERTDPSLLGGIVLRIGDEVLDGSVQGKFDSIQAAVEKGVQSSVRERFDSLMSS